MCCRWLVPMLLAATPLRAQSPAGGIRVSSGADLERCVRDTPGHPLTGSDFEPSAAVGPTDPSHIVVSWMTVFADKYISIRTAMSSDGGRTWSPPVTLPFTGCAGGPVEARYSVDTWVAIGSDGRGYLSALAAVGPPDPPATQALQVGVATSGEGGGSWDPPQVVASLHPPELWADNSSIAADPRRPGTAYLLVTRGRTPAAVIEKFSKGLPVDPNDIPRSAALAKTID